MSRLSLALCALALVLAGSLAAGVVWAVRGATAQATQPSHLVMIVLDGAEPSYLHLAGLPHLEALRRSGIEYDRAWAGILESETPAGHATLATGSTPAHDGLLGFNWVSDDDTEYHTFDPDVVRSG